MKKDNMDGFFSKAETASADRPDGKTYSCASCGLSRFVLTPRMAPFGNFHKGILNVGEAPGETEDKKGRQWQGKVGRRLQRAYKRLGVDLFEDCLNINSANCRPTDGKGNNREPTPYEISCCRSRVLKTIALHKPKVIVALGNSAIASLIGHRWKKDLGGISKWRGWTIPDRDLGGWVCPVFHPSFVERAEGQEVETIWEQDLERALGMMDIPFPHFEDERPLIEIDPNPDLIFGRVCAPLGDITPVAIDYETTGLKPHAPGHRVVCAAVAYHDKSASAFMVPTSRKGRESFLRFLANPDIGKMAHNMKFEQAWSVVRLRQSVENWLWDSMLAAHILDNRKGVTGLKFQAYVNFGAVGYESEVEEFLRAKDNKNGNAYNRIMELVEKPGGREKLLMYCGLDALYEYRLAMMQMNKMGAR